MSMIKVSCVIKTSIFLLDPNHTIIKTILPRGFGYIVQDYYESMLFLNPYLTLVVVGGGLDQTETYKRVIVHRLSWSGGANTT